MINKSLSKKILLLTYAFPPLQAPESFLSVKALAKIQSYKVDILTIDASIIDYARDASLENYVINNFGKVFRAKPSRWINKRSFKMLRYVSFFPDRFRFFNSQIYNKALEINVESYDLIISWSQWHSIHLVASKIKKKYPSLQWVSHFSDPWSDNPFLTRFLGYKASQYFFERRVIKNSNAINFTTNLSREMVMSKYPLSWMDKTYVTPHSYDSSLYKKNNTKKTKFVISYVGNFYGPRNPLTLLKSLSQIYQKDNDFFDEVVFRFIGKWFGNDDWNLKINDLPEGLIEVKSPVTYVASLAEISNSDLLLVIDAPFTSSVFFPSKLVDYIGSGLPILAITPEGSCLNILKNIGGLHAFPDSIDSISDGIEYAINSLKNKSIKSPTIKEKERYSNEYVSKEFEIMFKQLTET